MKLKNIPFIFSLFFAIISFSSCKDDENTKKDPVANFTFNPNGGYAPCSVQFTSSSLNGVDFTWDFGDGSTSIAENPIHVFNDPGTYTVTLKVKNADGQNQKSVQITIKKPFTKASLTKVVLTSMPFLDGSGSGWDAFDGPDLFMQLLSPNPDNTVLEESGVVSNLVSSMLPVTWNLTTPYTINDFNFSDFYFIQLMDSDALDPDDEIDYVSFQLDNYTTGSSPYPSTITRTQNSSTVTLHLNWTY
jgi:PKD repeat protein